MVNILLDNNYSQFTKNTKFNHKMENETKTSLERPLGKGKRRIDIGIHPLDNGIIIANCAGGLEDLDGRNDRYKKIGKFVQEKGIGTFVRIGNDLSSNPPWPTCVLDDYRYLVDYCKQNGEHLSGERNPKIFLMGYSAGAGIATIVGEEFSAEKMLLIAPGIDCGRKKIQKGLEKYTREVYIVIGENDHTVGTQTGRTFYKWAIKASKRELREIPQCTHDFEGETNSKILSKAPLFAFTGDETFPSPEGGITMYDQGKGPFVVRHFDIDSITGEFKEHKK